MAFKNYCLTTKRVSDSILICLAYASYFSGDNEGNFYTGFKWEYWDEIIIYYRTKLLKIKEENLLRFA